jgi:hypothetical protein
MRMDGFCNTWLSTAYAPDALWPRSRIAPPKRTKPDAASRHCLLQVSRHQQPWALRVSEMQPDDWWLMRWYFYDYDYDDDYEYSNPNYPDVRIWSVRLWSFITLCQYFFGVYLQGENIGCKASLTQASNSYLCIWRVILGGGKGWVQGGMEGWHATRG